MSDFNVTKKGSDFEVDLIEEKQQLEEIVESLRVQTLEIVDTLEGQQQLIDKMKDTVSHKLNVKVQKMYDMIFSEMADDIGNDKTNK